MVLPLFVIYQVFEFYIIDQMHHFWIKHTKNGSSQQLLR